MRKAPFSTQVRAETYERVKATVRGVVQSARADYTLSELTDEALNSYCSSLEETYNDGEPWPASEHPLRPGARMV